MSLQAAEASVLAASLCLARIFGVTGEAKEDFGFYQPQEPPASFEIIPSVSSLASANCPETAFACSSALLGLDLHYCQLELQLPLPTQPWPELFPGELIAVGVV